jgi:hypothetical protein
VPNRQGNPWATAARWGRTIRMFKCQCGEQTWIYDPALDMSSAMQRAHLTQAERHLASGIRHIEKQEQIIADLDRGGHDAAVVLELLTTFRDMQDHLVAHRARILEEIKHRGRLNWRPLLAPTATLSL